MVVPLSFYALVNYRFRCIKQRAVYEISLTFVLHLDDNVLASVSCTKDIVYDSSLVFCFRQHFLVLKLDISNVLFS